jgi:hypothetical protein
MRLKPFLLDAWLDTYEHGIEFNLAASTGPMWTANQILDFGDDQARERYLNHKVVYSRPAGADTLREAIASCRLPRERRRRQRGSFRSRTIHACPRSS